MGHARAAGAVIFSGVAVPGELPALPLHSAGKYVAAAYLVVFALVLIYVAIMAVRLSRIERELSELLAHEPSAAESEPASSRVESTVQ